MSDFHKIAQEIADLVVEKQAAYGDAFGKSGEVLEVLYPNGVKPEDYTNLLTVARILDKLFRIANQQDAFGEDPYSDVLGYSLLAINRRAKVEGNESNS